MYPPTKTPPSTSMGQETRGARIRAFGRGEHVFRFNKQQCYKEQVIYADVQKPYLWWHFLKKHGFVLDAGTEVLIDRKMNSPYRTQNHAPDHASLPWIHEVQTPGMPEFANFIARHYPKLLQHDFGADMPESGVIHRINMKPDAKPCRTRPRPLYGNKLKTAKRDWFELVWLGIIVPCESDWSSVLHLQIKKAGTWCPCGDYRALNAKTIPDHYPLPNIQTFTTVLKGARVFSRIDLKKAYHLIKIVDADQHKTAVITPWCLFKFRWLSMGLTNSAQAFQRLIDEVLRDLLQAEDCRVFVYLDDILIASPSAAEHSKDLHDVCSRLARYGLHTAEDKCLFGVAELEFLGFKVTTEGIAPLHEKVAAIDRFPVPKNVKQLQAFLGMVNYYRHLLKGAARVLHPLYEATKPVASPAWTTSRPKFSWTSELNEAFTAAKRLLAEYTMLVHPDSTAPLRLVNDASEIAYSAVLEQYNVRIERWKLLMFWSKGAKPSERQCPPYDKELQAIWLAGQ